MSRALAAALLLLASLAAPAGAAEPAHGIAIHGEPELPAGFEHYRYVNPDAPKGGTFRQSAPGTFDSLNPYILAGTASGAVAYVWEALMTQPADEANTEYGLLAESVETPPDRSWAIFNIDPRARWHDGVPVTAADVVWTFDTLIEKGHPQWRYYYGSVAKAEALSERRVKFTFAEGENRELPVIIAQLPVLPKHWWAERDFTKPTLEPPLGSGPYRIVAVNPGRSVALERVPDYWGRDLAVNVGRYNFDRIELEYFRDRSVERRAFAAGAFDVILENTAKEWATFYQFPAVRAGLVRKADIEHEMPAGMQAFAFNLRKPKFQDRRVRQALILAFDFEWANDILFFGQYVRTRSYFDNSELASTGLPSERELAILEPYRGRIPDEAFTQEYSPPSTEGENGLRRNLLRALGLLGEAGWVVRDFRLVDEETGEPFALEILLVSPAFERVALAYARNLERLGIRVDVRTVDTAQYQKRVDQFDFDMVIQSFSQSLSPGNEQRNFWTSAAAETPGSRNVIGVRDPVVDELVEQLIAASDRESLIAHTRALDRVLQWGFYVVPNWHISTFRLAWWDKFGQPGTNPRYGLGLDSWWYDPAKAAVVAAGLQRLRQQEAQEEE